MDFPQKIYSLYLEEIKGVKFTPREIDIISCIICGRAATIPSFLSISSRTVETHLRNIMIKIECNSREGIINFLENSDKYSHIKKYYQSLVISLLFEKTLKKAKNIINAATNKVCEIYFGTLALKDGLVIQMLVKNLAFMEVKSQITKNILPIQIRGILNSTDSKSTILLVLSNDELPNYQIESINDEYPTNYREKLRTSYDNLTFIMLEDYPNGDPSKDNENIAALTSYSENYYFTFLSLLLDIFPKSHLQQIISDFAEQYSVLIDGPRLSSIPSFKLEPTPEVELPIHKKPSVALAKKGMVFWKISLISLALVCFLSLFIVKRWNDFNSKHENHYQLVNFSSTNLNEIDFRNFLKRSHIIIQMDEKLQKQQGIKILALIGMGGVGKTMLAREFCFSKKPSLVWELNAQTKDALILSFNQLAETLVDTPEKKAILARVHQIQEPIEKEKQLLHFLKSLLKNQPHWILIYDNAETFAEIKNFVPRDPTSWGEGTVIITTRDSTIENSNYLIKSLNILEIQELTPKEGLVLFVRILYGKEPEELTSQQKQKVIDLLSHIPSFPLDISMAAYYIKNANLTFEQYIERIAKNSSSFESAQINFLKEVGQYDKTRFGIVSSSFKKVIEIDPDFQELLLLISFLDPHQIPKCILELFKDFSVVDQFVHELKKYSLSTSGVVIEQGEEIPVLTLHRSTQKHGQLYSLQLLNDNNSREFLEKIISKLEKFLQEANKKHHSNVILMLPHLDAFLKNIERFRLSPTQINEFQQRLLLIIGYAHWEFSANLVMAKRYFKKIIEIDPPSISPIILAKMLKDLARICWELCDFDEATIYSKKSIKIAENQKDPAILLAENLVVMGASYIYSNNFEKAYECFNTALSKISAVPSTEKMDLEARIYAQIATLYSTTYLHRTHINETEKFAYKALEIIGGNKNFHDNHTIHQQTLSCQVARNKLKLGDILCRLGKYEDAIIKGFKEAEFIIKHSLDNCSQTLLQNRINLGMGEAYLRTGQLQAAVDCLTDYIYKAENLLGERNTWTFLSRTLRAEALIRLGKLDEAYKDCKVVFLIDRKINNHYYNLMYITAFYHAAVIKYKEGNLRNAVRHFQEFFSEIKSFCRSFLSQPAYNELTTNNSFSVPLFEESKAKETIKECFEKSTQIFTTIYGNAHPIIQDYVYVCLEDAQKSGYLP